MKRHHWVIRLTHWINTIALIIMVGSGLRIFNAYPAFAPRGGTFCCYPFEGVPVPAWLTFGGWLAGARQWHFAMMWILVVNGLVYLGMKARLRVRRVDDVRRKYNRGQRIVYFLMPVFGIILVLSGLAIWKPVQLSLLTSAFGGYVWARYWHFSAMIVLVVLSIGHVFMATVVEPRSLKAMITGS